MRKLHRQTTNVNVGGKRRIQLYSRRLGAEQRLLMKPVHSQGLYQLSLQAQNNQTDHVTQEDGDSDAGHPKQSAPTEMSGMVLRGGDIFAESTGKDGAYQSGDSERKEIDAACSAPLNLVRIDFLDDRVRNHRCARGDAK